MDSLCWLPRNRYDISFNHRDYALSLEKYDQLHFCVVLSMDELASVSVLSILKKFQILFIDLLQVNTF